MGHHRGRQGLGPGWCKKGVQRVPAGEPMSVAVPAATWPSVTIDRIICARPYKHREHVTLCKLAMMVQSVTFGLDMVLKDIERFQC